MTRWLVVSAFVLSAAACGDDDAVSHTGHDGGDNDSGGMTCPNLAGEWTIEAHCGASLVGMTVPVTQVGCDITTGGTFSGFTGSVAVDGAFTLGGEANGTQVNCTGTATASTITQSCTGDCDVVLSK